MSDLSTELDELIINGQVPDEAPQDKIEQISDLLMGKELPAEEPTAAEQTGDSETEEEAEAAPEPEKDESGIDYAKEVPLRDGTKVTLGELKDHYQDRQARILETQERENALNTRMQELTDLAQYVQLPPQQMEVIKARQEQYLTQQHQLMLQAMPELNDKAAFTKVKQGIMGLASEYGVQDIVAQVSDHRVVKLLKDFVELRDSIKAAKDNVKPLRSSEPKAVNKPAGKPDAAAQAALRAATTHKMGDQIAAISALISPQRKR